jgi:predicted ribosomally synthesized peptide with nif11-like leader
MSKQAVLSFILEVNKDPSLYEKVNTLPSSRVEALLEVARDAGFEFSADEFVTTVLEQSRTSGELKEDELEQVAGGAVDMFNQLSSASPQLLNFTYKYLPTDYNKFG